MVYYALLLVAKCQHHRLLLNKIYLKSNKLYGYLPSSSAALACSISESQIFERGASFSETGKVGADMTPDIAVADFRRHSFRCSIGMMSGPFAFDEVPFLQWRHLKTFRNTINARFNFIVLNNRYFVVHFFFNDLNISNFR
jgi:hypothetical protein